MFREGSSLICCCDRFVTDLFLSSEKFTEVLNQQRQERAEKDRDRIRLLTADPFDPEAQRLIAEEIRQDKLLSVFKGDAIA